MIEGQIAIHEWKFVSDALHRDKCVILNVYDDLVEILKDSGKKILVKESAIKPITKNGRPVVAKKGLLSRKYILD